MHEMSLAEGILHIAEDTARREGAQRVRSVIVEIGRLSAVMPEALRFCFESVVRDSLAEGASLELVAVDGAGWCMPCGCEVPLQNSYDDCPRCGSSQIQLLRGTEMRVRELEIE
jgi:hydrogenase nickel incorporation protein HypA/HybF